MRHLSLGGVDLRRDLNTADGDLQTVYARSHLVVVSRAAGLEPPIDSVYPQLDDETGLRAQATFARSLGFFGKSAIHPRQLPILHDVFTPTDDQRAWAMQVIDAFESAGGEAVRLPSGEFVDVPVAQRARRLLELADALERRMHGTVDREAIGSLTPKPRLCGAFRAVGDGAVTVIVGG